ncbi:MAG: hypothetical protein ABH875_06955, partial [Candidatus Omnitrophota bacterium]
MIVSMKKVTLVAPQGHKDEFLTELRRLGVVHIRHVSPPSAESIGPTEEKISKTNKAIAMLEGCNIPQAAGKVIWERSQIQEKADEIVAMAFEREDLVKSNIYLENRLEQFKPWGSFDPKALKALADKDISVRLYRATKGALKKINQEGRGIQIINEDKRYVYLAQITRKNEEALPLEEVHFPEESFEELYGRHESAKNRIDQIENHFRASARACGLLWEHLRSLEKKKAFLNAANGMGDEKGFSYLQGYCPVDKIKNIASLAKANDLGYLIEDPTDPQETPTLIRNPRWIEIINPVFKFMNVIPGYKEQDISIWFLAFFSLFFAMLIGDAGYGLLFLAVTLFAQRKFKKAPREPFMLMYLLSLPLLDEFHIEFVSSELPLK